MLKSWHIVVLALMALYLCGQGESSHTLTRQQQNECATTCAMKCSNCSELRGRSGVLCVLQPNGQHRKVPQHHQNLRILWECLRHRDPLGQSALLLRGSPKAVLCLKALHDQGAVSVQEEAIHATVLHSHLVRRLGLQRVLPGRQVQLLCHRKLDLDKAMNTFLIIFSLQSGAPASHGDKLLTLLVTLLGVGLLAGRGLSR